MPVELPICRRLAGGGGGIVQPAHPCTLAGLHAGLRALPFRVGTRKFALYVLVFAAPEFERRLRANANARPA